MHSSAFTPFGERSLTLVVGVFDDAARAEQVASQLRRQPGQHTFVLHPHDPRVARLLEPEQRGIWRTLVRSHATLMPLGALMGGVVAIGLSLGGWSAAARSPYFTMLFLGVAGLFLGGILAGLLTSRPDHGVVIRRARAALARGAHAVVVHPLSRLHTRAAVSTLEQAGAVAMRSV